MSHTKSNNKIRPQILFYYLHKKIISTEKGWSGEKKKALLFIAYKSKL